MSITASTFGQNDLPRKEYPPLSHDITVDVAIIGGGITGVLTAYLLNAAGKTVALIEKRRLGQAATGLTTAFLTYAIDTTPSDLIRVFGAKDARLIFESHQKAIDLIESLATKEHIECEFTRCNAFVYALAPSDLDGLSQMHDAIHGLGLSSTLQKEPLPGISSERYVILPQQAKMHPIKFLLPLAEAAERHGAFIFERTRAKKIAYPEIITNRGTIRAEWIITATHHPFLEPPGLFLKKGRYWSYVIEFVAEKSGLDQGIYWDTRNPYHYFRTDPQPNGDRIILGGEDHRADILVSPEKSFQALEAYAAFIFQDKFKVVRKWRGSILEPVDGLAFIGPHGNSKTLYAFGFSGNGMTYAGIAAQIFADNVLRVQNDMAKIYRADRLPAPKALMVKGRDYFGELINGALKNLFRA